MVWAPDSFHEIFENMAFLSFQKSLFSYQRDRMIHRQTAETNRKLCERFTACFELMLHRASPPQSGSIPKPYRCSSKKNELGPAHVSTLNCVNDVPKCDSFWNTRIHLQKNDLRCEHMFGHEFQHWSWLRNWNVPATRNFLFFDKQVIVEGSICLSFQNIDGKQFLRCEFLSCNQVVAREFDSQPYVLASHLAH